MSDRAFRIRRAERERDLARINLLGAFDLQAWHATGARPDSAYAHLVRLLGESENTSTAPLVNVAPAETHFLEELHDCLGEAGLNGTAMIETQGAARELAKAYFEPVPTETLPRRIAQQFLSTLTLGPMWKNPSNVIVARLDQLTDRVSTGDVARSMGTSGLAVTTVAAGSINPALGLAVFVFGSRTMGGFQQMVRSNTVTYSAALRNTLLFVRAKAGTPDFHKADRQLAVALVHYRDAVVALRRTLSQP